MGGELSSLDCVAVVILKISKFRFSHGTRTYRCDVDLCIELIIF